MMSEAQFWEEFRRLVREDDIEAAQILYAAHLEAMNEVAMSELMLNQPRTLH